MLQGVLKQQEPIAVVKFSFNLSTHFKKVSGKSAIQKRPFYALLLITTVYKSWFIKINSWWSFFSSWEPLKPLQRKKVKQDDINRALVYSWLHTICCYLCCCFSCLQSRRSFTEHQSQMLCACHRFLAQSVSIAFCSIVL